MLESNKCVCSCVVFQVVVAPRKWVVSTLWCEINNERDMGPGRCDGNGDRVSGVQQGMVSVFVSVIKEILTLNWPHGDQGVRNAACH